MCELESTRSSRKSDRMSPRRLCSTNLRLPHLMAVQRRALATRPNRAPRGKRQIFSFHIPGDIPDLQSLHLNVMDHNLGTLTPCKLAFIPHEKLTEFFRRCPRIGDVMWRDTLIDAAVFREWMIGIGRRSAYTRIAHVLCEVLVKLRSVGL